ncbi:MAG: lauroyl acyltransferase [Alphaproteobacteria bacterium]|nr:lauroyl acyltransferase [Alphaproteobacteria bacterium]
MKRLRFRLEAWLITAVLWLLGRLRPEAASNLGGAVARMIGPRLRVSRVADANLRLAMPACDAPTRARIIRGVWDNLGRTACEFPHVPALRETASGPGYELEGAAHFDAVLAAGGPAICISAHLANWEVMPAAAKRRGADMASFYRAASNPLTDAIIIERRARAGVTLIAKGAAGARAGVAHLRAGGILGFLIDQKMNDGIEARLFGHPAMTASAAAALALRFAAPVIPARVIRLGPARFRVVAEAPLALPATGDRHGDIAALTQAMNDCIERWVGDTPEQWLWLHRRWPREIMPE